jgi:phosphatidylserine/phosphatidylglycerophosphate/cardiolipin synthase-like enzyme
MLSLIISLLLTGLAFAEPAAAPASGAAQVSLLVGRKDSQRARADLIRAETKEIRLSTFHFHLDDHGKETLGLLVDAAQRGVKVKLILDGLPEGLSGNRPMLKALTALGVEIKLYNPVYRRLLSVNNRTHMKSLMGSDSMIIGDRNMTEDYFARKNGNTYISTDVRISDPANQRTAITHFDDFFQSSRALDLAGPSSLIDVYAAEVELKRWAQEAVAKHVPMRTLQTHSVPGLRYIADNPEPSIHSKSGINREILGMLRRAEKSLTLMNPYVFMTPELKHEFQNAIRRGVKITIMTNSSTTTDSRLTAMAWEHSRNEISKLGIELYELKDGSYIHAKTIIRDGKEVFIGSYNLDPRSQNLNVENGVFFEDERIAGRLTSHTSRVQRRMMTRVQPIETFKMDARERASHCIKSGIRRMILAPIYFAL